MAHYPGFRTDLYRGTAFYYDRYRPPYPAALFNDLRSRLGLPGQGRLLDLACGTGQIAIPLAADFVEVVAVDQEPEAIRVGRAKAERAGTENIRWIAGSAETVALEGSFDVLTVGNAFHRLDRSRVAERARGWLRPAGALALVWGDTPSNGARPWQRAMEDLLADWMFRAGTADRVAPEWQAALKAEPHDQVLRQAGFDYDGKFEFTAEQTWNVESLIGFVYSTSVLNRRALGGLTETFEEDLVRRLLAANPDAVFHQEASFAYELAHKL